ncbi:MAG: ABC transporter substrate-binding protein [Acidobacteriota bacterium]
MIGTRRVTRAGLLASLLVVLTACGGTQHNAPAGADAPTVDTPRLAPLPPVALDPDAIDDPLRVQHAERFSLERVALGANDAVVLSVRPPWQAPGVLRYLLVSRDHAPETRALDTQAFDTAPLDLAALRESGDYDAVIEVPVERLATTSTTELGHLVSLELAERWIAHSEPRYVSSPALRRRVDAGAVVNVGAGAGRIEPESLLAARPEVLLADFMSRDQLDALVPARAAGLHVVLVPAFLEPTPLGRAEWVKVLGALGGRSDQAAAVFAGVEGAYETLRQRVAEAVAAPAGADGPARPKALTGGPYDDVWHVPGGVSYPARLLADAGADYPWRDAPTERALPLDVERVLERAGDSALWLWPSHWRSRREIVAADPRLAAFAALRDGAVWSADRRVNGHGGNDFWEGGAARPDLVLADLVRIVHPELMPERALVFHRRLDDPLP